MEDDRTTHRRAATRRRAVSASIAALVLAAGCATTDAAEIDEASRQGSPTDDGPAAAVAPEPVSDTDAATAPAARIYHSLVSDGGQLYLFDGLTSHGWGPGLADVWAYAVADDRWEARSTPGGVEFGSPAWDAGSKRFIMLDLDGGTWAYDPANDTWEQRDPAQAPSTRCGERTVYDTQSDLVVLFGGFACTGTNDPGLDDTWTYDYDTDTWEQVEPATSPPGRMFHGMVYDEAADRTVLWGGRVDDTRVWTLDLDDGGGDWTVQDTDGGPTHMRAYHGMSYDPHRRQVLVFGGLEPMTPTSLSGELKGDLWAYDVPTASWTQLADENAPAPRALHQLALDPDTGQHVMFGGEVGHAYSDEITDETWILDSTSLRWTGPRRQ